MTKNLSFRKMHGLGNDVVVVRAAQGTFSLQDIRHIADRRHGVGCDQLLVMEAPQAGNADLFMRIYNADGSEAQACGNGTRCVAHLWMTENNRDHCTIETVSGLLACRMVDGGGVEVDMGVPRFGWQDIPLAEERDTLHLGVMSGSLTDPVAVNVGNPHTVFFVDDIEQVDVEGLGRQVEQHVLFPERTNVGFAQVLAPEKIRLRVWERGTGVTQACGSGACAAMVAAVRRGLSSHKAEVLLDGGSLFLQWRREDEHILMTGSVSYVFQGELECL
ncbi:MAG: diaminopimelate epimerase [Alphaproteobacteria bacterium CG_4_9_14_3_um_filter_47_13]|nr:MAG: diaminopimelate epimerase [Alphaproteobacteria bacterium CG_4_9_14_3_um_filter_47_13]